MASRESRKVLVVAPSWVGDTVFSQSLYQVLKRQGAEVHALAPRALKILIDRIPEVDVWINMPIAHSEIKLRERYRLAQTLRKQQYDQAIIITRSLKAAIVPWLARIPIRTGYRGEMRFFLINDMRFWDQSKMPRLVDRYVGLAYPRTTPLSERAAPLPRLKADAGNAARLRRKMGLDSARPILAVMPGVALAPAKKWPSDYYAAVAKQYAEMGWQIWVLGAQSDRKAGDLIVRQCRSDAFNLCGETTLADAADLLSLAHLSIANDSGLMHIAAAVGCPVVAIYGGSPIERAPPLGPGKQLYHRLQCSPCEKKTCRYGHYQCLKAVKPDAVYAAAQALLKERPAEKAARLQ